MLKKITMILAIVCCENVNADTLGFETCLSADKITHVPGQPWEISADSSGWVISNNNRYSVLTQLSPAMLVERKVEPYHILSKLADTTCDYGPVILTRTYSVGDAPFPTANYIGADTNIDSSGDYFISTFNWATSCATTLDNLTKCKWMFYHIDTAPPLPLSPYPFFGAFA